MSPNSGKAQSITFDVEVAFVQPSLALFRNLFWGAMANNYRGTCVM